MVLPEWPSYRRGPARLSREPIETIWRLAERDERHDHASLRHAVSTDGG